MGKDGTFQMLLLEEIVLEEIKSTVSNVYVNTKILMSVGNYNITNVIFRRPRQVSLKF